MKTSVVWGIEPLCPVKKSSTCYLLHSGLLLSVHFDSEDGGNIFLRNICSL
jgi:hypothetical protein